MKTMLFYPLTSPFAKMNWKERNFHVCPPGVESEATLVQASNRADSTALLLHSSGQCYKGPRSSRGRKECTETTTIHPSEGHDAEPGVYTDRPCGWVLPGAGRSGWSPDRKSTVLQSHRDCQSWLILITVVIFGSRRGGEMIFLLANS